MPPPRHPTSSSSLHQRSALSPRGSAMSAACLPACLPRPVLPPTSTQLWSVPLGFQRGLEEQGGDRSMGWGSVERSRVQDQVTRTPTLLFGAAEMTPRIICISE